MIIKGVKIKLSSLVCLFLYYSIAQYLPVSYSRFGGAFSKKIRYFLCKRIFKFCGKNVNIERKAHFGTGRTIVIGDNSGLGYCCNVPSNISIGKDVMMGPNCFIIKYNHSFDRIDIPMIEQGYQSTENVPTIIEDDVWIGMNVLMTAGRHIKKGTIIGAGCLLCKDFPEYSIVGGNPSKLIRSRIKNAEYNK